MGSWHPADLVTDQDLVDYESTILTKFGASTWLAKRTKALEDWLFPILRANRFDPQQLRTRFEADRVLGLTGGVYTDLTVAARDGTADDLNLAAVIATPATDALYVGAQAPFRGLFVGVTDQVSSASATLSARYWSGQWATLDVTDGTIASAGKTLSGGGSVVWPMPADWSRRALADAAATYWVKVTLTATPTGAKAGQLAVIRASLLRAPAIYRTLQLIFAEAETGADGPWVERADFYGKEAAAAMSRALPLIGDEFDTDASDQIGAAEAGQTSAEVSGGGWRLERG
jgi:hypothetical protein